MDKKIKVYENGQPNPQVIFSFIREILEEGLVSSDLGLSIWLIDS